MYFYETGTSTPLDTYSDNALSSANANPVVADSNGRFAAIFLKGQDYKVVLKTSADVTIWTEDPCHGGSVADLVDDTTPQLGGTLDTNDQQMRWSKGADVASAAALTLGTDGNYFDITGTTAITSIGDLGGDGTVIKLHFDGALTLTHHATDLILPGAASITTAAGDEYEFVNYATGDWRMTGFALAAGSPPEILYANVDDELTKGFSGAVHDNGTKTTGTFTPDEANGNIQKYVNGGAHTLAPTAEDTTVVLQCTNDASAGAITTSGFDIVDGDTLTTTNGDDFIFYLTTVNGFQHLTAVAMQ